MFGWHCGGKSSRSKHSPGGAGVGHVQNAASSLTPYHWSSTTNDINRCTALPSLIPSICLITTARRSRRRRHRWSKVWGGDTPPPPPLTTRERVCGGCYVPSPENVCIFRFCISKWQETEGKCFRGARPLHMVSVSQPVPRRHQRVYFGQLECTPTSLLHYSSRCRQTKLDAVRKACLLSGRPEHGTVFPPPSVPSTPTQPSVVRSRHICSAQHLTLLVFIARQHNTDARYWYSKSVCLSVCP